MLHMCMVYESKPTVVLEPIAQGCSSTSRQNSTGGMLNQRVSDDPESALRYGSPLLTPKIILHFKSF